MNLGTIKGVGVDEWNLEVYRAPNAIYAKVSTDDVIDPNVETGVEFWMNLGEYTTVRTKDTYIFNIGVKGGKAKGVQAHYPNNRYTLADMSYVGRTCTNINGVTTISIMIPWDSFNDSISLDNTAISFKSYSSGKYVDWTYKDSLINASQPIKYLGIDEDNQVYLFSELYKNLGVISATNLQTWDLNVYRSSNAIYARVQTTDTIDAATETGIQFWVNVGDNTLSRTADTYCIKLAMKNGNVTGATARYLGGKYTEITVTGIERSFMSEDGKITMDIRVPFSVFEKQVTNENLAITFASYKGNTVNKLWSYSGCSLNADQPVKYLTVTENNYVYLAGEGSIYQTMKNNNVLKTGYEDAFDNLAVIEATTGIMAPITNGGLLFDDKTTNNYVFDTSEAQFLEGKSYVYTGFGEGGFKVNESGYVFLMIPGSTAYSALRSKVGTDGWKVLFTAWNNMGSMNDKVTYYAKWCEAGETYSYGEWNIAVGDASSVE